MRLTTRTSVMGRKHDIVCGRANVWKKLLKNEKYELIENAIDKLGQLEDLMDKYNFSSVEQMDEYIRLCNEYLASHGAIEKELGIDIITLFKALKNGYYYKSIKGKILFSQNSGLVPYQNELELDHKFKLLSEAILKPKNCIFVCVRDYGKTWALTKEELV